jgi:hypothetical protein
LFLWNWVHQCSVYIYIYINNVCNVYIYSCDKFLADLPSVVLSDLLSLFWLVFVWCLLQQIWTQLFLPNSGIINFNPFSQSVSFLRYRELRPFIFRAIIETYILILIILLFFSGWYWLLLFFFSYSLVILEICWFIKLSMFNSFLIDIGYLFSWNLFLPQTLMTVTTFLSHLYARFL